MMIIIMIIVIDATTTENSRDETGAKTSMSMLLLSREARSGKVSCVRFSRTDCSCRLMEEAEEENEEDVYGGGGGRGGGRGRRHLRMV